MNVNLEGLLGIVILLPFFGALCISSLPSMHSSIHRFMALLFTLLTFLNSLLLWANFRPIVGGDALCIRRLERDPGGVAR